jgi:hypothetical protein
MLEQNKEKSISATDCSSGKTTKEKISSSWFWQCTVQAYTLVKQQLLISWLFIISAP